MLLIYPPAARSSEAPLGLARLAGFLREHGQDVRCLDLCLEGIDFLLARHCEAPDARAKVALARRGRDRALLLDPETYGNRDRYRRSVVGLNRALKTIGAEKAVEPGLADFRDLRRSPLRRADLLTLAAGFEENIYFPLFSRRIEEELHAFSALDIGISIGFLSQALCAFAIAGFVRARWPEKRVVLGGGLISSWIGQGSLAPDENFGGLIDALLPGRGEEGLSAHLGLMATDDRIRPALPDFSDFASLPYFAPTRIIPYNFSWGCPWKRCTFCPERAEDAAYAAVSVDRAREELGALVSRQSPGLLHFTDNEIAPLYLRSLAEDPPGVAWYGFSRFTPLLCDAAFCRRLAASGCVMLQLGLESGDQRVLDAVQKGTRLDQIDRALESLAVASIAVYLYLLFGTPEEDYDSALRSRDYIAARTDRIAFMNVAVFNMPIAGPDAARLRGHPFYEGDLSLYQEFEHPRGWNRDRVRAFISKDLEGDAKIGEILARTPPVFTSNHAPFCLGAR